MNYYFGFYIYYLANVLNFNDEIYRKLLKYKSLKPNEEKTKKIFNRKARTYWDKSLIFVSIRRGSDGGDAAI